MDYMSNVINEKDGFLSVVIWMIDCSKIGYV